MTQETLKLRSSIKKPLIHSRLMRGSLIALPGACLLFYGAAFMSPDQLSVWGLPLLLCALGFITVGLLPYRRLTRLEMNPNEIIAVGNKCLQFVSQKKLLLTIPTSSIQQISYLDQGSLYGIGIMLKQAPKEKIVVHDPRFNVENFRKNSLKLSQCDLFFQYFTQRSYNMLKEFQNEESES